MLRRIYVWRKPPMQRRVKPRFADPFCLAPVAAFCVVLAMRATRMQSLRQFDAMFRTHERNETVPLARLQGDTPAPIDAFHLISSMLAAASRKVEVVFVAF